MLISALAGGFFEGPGGKKVSVALSSFIRCFEFCVQILVPPSGLTDGSNNIRPLRNQFQMLNVTDRSWKFGVGRKRGYRGTPIKEGTLFFSRIYTLSEFSAAF